MLVSGLSQETDLLWEGRMPTQAPEIDGVTLINDFEGGEPRQGEIRRLRITEAHDYDVVGTLLPGASRRRGSPIATHQYRVFSTCMTVNVRFAKRKSRSAPRISLLQRALPHYRSGQLGQGKISISRAGNQEEEQDNCPNDEERCAPLSVSIVVAAQIAFPMSTRLAILLATWFGCGSPWRRAPPDPLLPSRSASFCLFASAPVALPILSPLMLPRRRLGRHVTAQTVNARTPDRGDR